MKRKSIFGTLAVLLLCLLLVGCGDSEETNHSEDNVSNETNHSNQSEDNDVTNTPTVAPTVAPTEAADAGKF